MKIRYLPLLLMPALLAVAAPAFAVASAELYQNQTYTYGRFEARVRFAAGDGVISSFFLWKPGSEMPDTYWNELDFEKLGATCRLQTNPLYGLPVGDHSQVAVLDADLCGEYHTYSFEWTPSYIAYLVDGVEVRRDGEETAAAFADNAAAGMQMHFNVWPGDATFGGNFDPASLPVQQYISWVQYSSFADGAFTFAWREEFDAGLPSGWAVGNWASPKNLSTHQAANATFTGGVSVLSLTADGATGFTGTPPVDVVVDGPPGPDASAGSGGAPGTAGSAGVPPGNETSGGMTGSTPEDAGSTGNPTTEAPSGAGTSGTATSGAGTSGTAAPEARPAAVGSACSYAVSFPARSNGGAWLAVGGAALITWRRRLRLRRSRGALGS